LKEGSNEEGREHSDIGEKRCYQWEGANPNKKESELWNIVTSVNLLITFLKPSNHNARSGLGDTKSTYFSFV